ncbi:hypothetical protein [Paracoccus denitrificans]|jgi:hypothetical protein|uniref:D-galactarate dehydratase n=1 Tax=Paracoccus denitrificans (strain Pd 1222) TaxID=318586 RepID=A1B4A3_PARDP|nr:hypothetical protein [Paracoccus denitrificans]ABL70347.1 conserved hypothetical protein [Paracoccus denitrificans PD1222]MBB4627258.1 hypothetical protein [Paracoccus denitrificans]MCU7427969.1 hypothetical protein [Paracoccus denitrificans]QAR25696.1 hypothetical protein EO213_04950 [Paracoccus denitrificans]UPV94597.1 hypothetical protein M0K93_12235 [Paracoccus denitrificans]
MTKPILRLPGALMLLALAACTPADKTPQTAPGATTASDQRAASAAGTALVTAAARPSPAARTAAEFDTTTREQRVAAAAPPTTGERRLGTTIASLGDPSQPGFWIKTPLAKSETDGRIVNPANGKSAKVRLIPLDGPASGGSQVSLPALQLIGVSLTDLPTIEVYGS